MRAAQVVERIDARLSEVVGPIISRDGRSKFALLDFPDYGNVGDSAIWLGERALLGRFERHPAFASTHEVDWNSLEGVIGEGPVYLQGGGSFGDVWPILQNFRNELLSRYPGRTVVQLPQSIHFSDEAAISSAARSIARNGAFKLLVRDEESLEFARGRFDCESFLCPDAAFAMGVQKRRSAPDLDVLLVLRTDKEKILSADVGQLPGGWQVADWLEDDAGVHRSALKAARVRSVLSLRPWRSSARKLDYFDELAGARVERGLRLLSRGKVIISDRLHVHILATLLGIPHVMLDNSYGKIGRFSRAFATGWDGTAVATTFEEATVLAKALLGRVQNGEF